MATAATLAAILTLTGGLTVFAGRESRRVFSRLSPSSLTDDSLSILTQRSCQSEFDCAIVCATSPDCLKFSFQAAGRVCQLSHMANALLGGGAWLDMEGAKDLSSLCPMAVTDGRRFCVFQRRISSAVAFDMPWRLYEIGFGNAQNWWIGLRHVHSLTQPAGRRLRVELSLASGESFHFEYSGFRVANASQSFAMTYEQLLAEASSGSNDSLTQHRGMRFSTRDRDNDLLPDGSCSEADGLAGWWYNSCYSCNPNGVWGPEAPGNGSSEAAGEELGAAMWSAASDTQGLASVRLMLQV